jgi:hypothetical protein
MNLSLQSLPYTSLIRRSSTSRRFFCFSLQSSSDLQEQVAEVEEGEGVVMVEGDDEEEVEGTTAAYCLVASSSCSLERDERGKSEGEDGD